MRKIRQIIAAIKRTAASGKSSLKEFLYRLSPRRLYGCITDVARNRISRSVASVRSVLRSRWLVATLAVMTGRRKVVDVIRGMVERKGPFVEVFTDPRTQHVQLRCTSYLLPFIDRTLGRLISEANTHCDMWGPTEVSNVATWNMMISEEISRKLVSALKDKKINVYQSWGLTRVAVTLTEPIRRFGSLSIDPELNNMPYRMKMSQMRSFVNSRMHGSIGN